MNFYWLTDITSDIHSSTLNRLEEAIMSTRSRKVSSPSTDPGDFREEIKTLIKEEIKNAFANFVKKLYKRNFCQLLYHWRSNLIPSRVRTRSSVTTLVIWKRSKTHFFKEQRQWTVLQKVQPSYWRDYRRARWRLLRNVIQFPRKPTRNFNQWYRNRPGSPSRQAWSSKT